MPNEDPALNTEQKQLSSAKEAARRHQSGIAVNAAASVALTERIIQAVDAGGAWYRAAQEMGMTPRAVIIAVQ